MPTLGLDIGGTRVKSALVGDDGRELAVAKSDSYRRPDRAALLKALRQVVPEAAFERVGLCAPGMMDPAKTMVEASVNVPGLCGWPLVELVAEATGRDVPPPAVVGDAVASALDVAAEHELGGRLLLLAIGTGVGAAVLDDGVPLEVDGASPGHFGQLDVSLSRNPPLGPDGGAGGLEAYLGARVLRGRQPGELRSDSRAVRALVRALRIGHAIYRPHHIALAGGVGIRLAPLAESIHEQTAENLTNIARTGWQLHFGRDDYHAARGAARGASGPPGRPIASDDLR